MAAETQRLSATERDNLVAYLDGELPDGVRDAMATALSKSVTARREIESLAESWDLLDLLPRPRASEQFLATTLGELAKFDQPKVDWHQKARGWTRSVGVSAALVAGLVAVFGVGYAVVRWMVPDPTGRLQSQLSIARHFDEYQAIGGDFEFLKELDRLPEFNVDSH